MTRTTWSYSQQGRRQLREIGGGKIKIRGAKLKTSVELGPNFHYSWIGLRRSFSENQVISEKKKVFAEIRRPFLAEITNLNVFFRPKTATFSSQKNTLGARNKSGGGGKNENRGGNAPCPPRWRRAWLPVPEYNSDIHCKNTNKKSCAIIDFTNPNTYKSVTMIKPIQIEWVT